MTTVGYTSEKYNYDICIIGDLVTIKNYAAARHHFPYASNHRSYY